MFDKIVEKSVKDSILEKFVQSFLKKNYSFFDNKTNIKKLMWCNFTKERNGIFPIENLPKLVFPENENLFFYLERTNELYKTNFFEICEYVKKLEPWDEIDAEIFDETMNWVVVITHEDFLITIGL